MERPAFNEMSSDLAFSKMKKVLGTLGLPLEVVLIAFPLFTKRNVSQANPAVLSRKEVRKSMNRC